MAQVAEPEAARSETASPEVVLNLADASAAYAGRTVLGGIDLTVRRGERVALLGRSGAGKSTLIGLLHAEAPHRVALVPQAAALVRQLSVFHNVYMGRLDQNRTAHNLRTLVWPARADLDAVRAVLARVGLADRMREAAGALSGGQQQRVSVARALYDGRPILLADEPVSALDRVQGALVLAELAATHGTMVVALHDVALALAHATRVVVVADGRIALDAPAADLDAAALRRHYADEGADEAAYRGIPA